MNRVLLFGLILLILLGCQPQTVIVRVPDATLPDGTPAPYQFAKVTYRIERHIDYESGLVCMIYVGYNMQCFPIAQTQLGQE